MSLRKFFNGSLYNQRYLCLLVYQHLALLFYSFLLVLLAMLIVWQTDWSTLWNAILTAVVMTIELSLVASTMLTDESNPTLARDPIFSVFMITLTAFTGIWNFIFALIISWFAFKWFIGHDSVSSSKFFWCTHLFWSNQNNMSSCTRDF